MNWFHGSFVQGRLDVSKYCVLGYLDTNRLSKFMKSQKPSTIWEEELASDSIMKYVDFQE